MATAGRKSKLNETVINKMTELVKHGNYIEVAAAACGVTGQSFYNWMNKARAIVESYPDIEVDDLDDAVAEGTLTDHEANCVRLFESMKMANAEAEATAVLHVRKQMPDQWQAAMTFLERRFPGRWKRREQIDHNSSFDPVGSTDGAIDERALLQDPEAVALLHEALTRAAMGELPATVDSTAVETDTPLHIRTQEDETD